MSEKAHPTDIGTIALADHSCFFVGGDYREIDTGVICEGSMYVECFVPTDQSHDLPVVMVHGKGQTGTNFIATPDGRRGWLHDFLRAGYAVYIVDQPERGRSGHVATSYANPGALAASTADHVERRLVGFKETMQWPMAHHHTQWPGTGKRGDAAFDQFYASQVESLTDGMRTQELNRDALCALLDRIGRAIVLTHSQAGTFGWLVADARPELVSAIIAIEPAGPPFRNVVFDGDDADWYRHSEGLSMPWGIASIPLSYDPPVVTPDDLEPTLDDEPIDPELVRVYKMGGRARRLPNLAGIPIAIVSGQASYHATYDYGTSRFLTSAGVENDHIKLVDLGLKGNGHMMMLEKNNHEIADQLLEWLNRNVEG